MRKRLLQHSFCIILGLYAPVVANSHSVSTPESGLQESPAVIAKVDPRVELMSIIARLAGFQEYVRNDFKLYADDFDELKPRVAAMSPFNNDAQDVDPGITQMTITFDKPMSVKGYSF